MKKYLLFIFCLPALYLLAGCDPYTTTEIVINNTSAHNVSVTLTSHKYDPHWGIEDIEVAAGGVASFTRSEMVYCGELDPNKKIEWISIKKSGEAAQKREFENNNFFVTNRVEGGDCWYTVYLFNITDSLLQWE